MSLSMTRIRLGCVFTLLLITSNASAQVQSYLVSRYITQASCFLTGVGCYAATCSIADSADDFVRVTQYYDIWGELVCPGDHSVSQWEAHHPSLAAQGQCNFALPCTPIFQSPQVWN